MELGRGQKRVCLCFTPSLAGRGGVTLRARVCLALMISTTKTTQ